MAVFPVGRGITFSTHGVNTTLYYRGQSVFRLSVKYLREFALQAVCALARQANASASANAEARFLSVSGPTGDASKALNLGILPYAGRLPVIQVANSHGYYLEVELSQVDDLIIALARTRNIAATEHARNLTAKASCNA